MGIRAAALAKKGAYRTLGPRSSARLASIRAKSQPLVNGDSATPKQLPGQKQRAEPFIPLIILALFGVPALTYYYWQHRDAHMRQKKTAILRDYQARAARGE